MSGPCVMLVAGEASGDILGGALAGALRNRLGPEVRFVGVGGRKMAEQGVASPVDIGPLAILGVFNAIWAWPMVVRRARQAAAIARREAPDVAVLIDSWGFTLRVARRLRRIDPGLPLIKYVAPQVWATRPGRARTLARTVDRLMTIHTFDAPLFKRHGLPVTFVGNPALARDFSGADPERLRAAIEAAPGDPILLVLPGSRPSEVRRLLAPFEAACGRLKTQWPDLRVVVAAAEDVEAEVAAGVAGWPFRVHVARGETERLDAMRAATVALACSGTVTTELALAGCPMVVAYRLGPLTHAVASVLIRTRYITLFNVAAQAFVAPERVQGACTGPILARDLTRLLKSPALRARQVASQNAALTVMGGGIADPAAAAADAVVEVLRRKGRWQASPQAGSGTYSNSIR